MADDFAVELTPYEVQEGHERVVSDDADRRYAGEWYRRLVAEADADELTIGTFDDPVRGPDHPARLPVDSLRQHALITGATGLGSGTLSTELLRQVAARGHGLALLSRGGEEARRLLEQLPADRLDDVVWVDPQAGDDDSGSGGFNLLSPSRAVGDDRRAAEVDGIVQTLLAVIGDQPALDDIDIEPVAEPLLRHHIVEYNEHTLVDVAEALPADAGDDPDPAVDEALDGLLTATPTETLLALREALAPFTTGEFVTSALNEHLGGRFGQHVRDGDIVLISLPAQEPADESRPLDALLLGLWAAQMGNQDADDLFVVGVDALDAFTVTPRLLSDITSMGRSMRFGTILSVAALGECAPAVKTAAMNAQHIFTFRPQRGDTSEAGRLAQEFNMGAQQLLALDRFEFVGRLKMTNGQLSDPFVFHAIPQHPPLRIWTATDVCNW
jgi:hypothetical protein